MNHVVFETLILVRDKLVEGTLHGEFSPNQNYVFFVEFIPTSAETKGGDPIDPAELPPVMHYKDFGLDDIAMAEEELLCHYRENQKVKKIKPFRVPLDDRLVDVYCASFSRATRGYFSHRTGAGESPCGPEADIALIRDVKTGETLPVEELDDEKYDRLVLALEEEVMNADALVFENAFPKDD